tara:strand:+ start:772 stop:996 length:225 start_codon:yes stop_codon:yes gene_type:complete
MNYKDYTEGTRSTYGDDPTEFNGSEPIKCKLCHADLDAEEISEEIDYCFDCFYSCCNVEIDQDIRICPICKEHN